MPTFSGQPWMQLCVYNAYCAVLKAFQWKSCWNLLHFCAWSFCPPGNRSTQVVSVNRCFVTLTTSIILVPQKVCYATIWPSDSSSLWRLYLVKSEKKSRDCQVTDLVIRPLRASTMYLSAGNCTDLSYTFYYADNRHWHVGSYCLGSSCWTGLGRPLDPPPTAQLQNGIAPPHEVKSFAVIWGGGLHLVGTRTQHSGHVVWSKGSVLSECQSLNCLLFSACSLIACLVYLCSCSTARMNKTSFIISLFKLCSKTQKMMAYKFQLWKLFSLSQWKWLTGSITLCQC